MDAFYVCKMGISGENFEDPNLGRMMWSVIVKIMS